MPNFQKIKCNISIPNLQIRNKPGKLKIVIIIILLSTLALIIIWNKKEEEVTETSKSYSYFSYKNVSKVQPDVLCHYIVSSDTLPDISTFPPKREKSIFFIESSCRSHFNGKISIKPRQACAVESAAKLNPDYDVYLLFVSPGKVRNEGTESDRILQQLLKYPNIKLLYVNIEKFIRDTPVESLWKTGAMDQSQYVMVHTSDILRVLVLWKYGGIYLDLDVVVIKNLEELGSNFVGVESVDWANSAVMSFDLKDGFKFANSCLYEFQNNFRGNEWAYNGPKAITRLIRRMCHIESLPEIIGKSCNNIKIYPIDEFYAIDYYKWQFFFNESNFDEAMELTKKSHIIHLWNQATGGHKIPLNRTKSFYMYYAQECCPNVVKECDEYF